MNKPDNHIDRLFKEKLNSTEAENPSGEAAWAKMNTLLQAAGTATIEEEKEEQRGAVIVWFRQYSMAIAAALLIALTGIASLVIIQKENPKTNAIAMVESEEGNGTETVLPAPTNNPNGGKTTTETKNTAPVTTNGTTVPANPSINGVLPNTNKEVKPRSIKREKKPSLRKQYPDIARMQTLVAMADVPHNSAKMNASYAKFMDKQEPVLAEPNESEVATTKEELANNSLSDFVMVPVKIIYKGSLPSAEQLAAYKAEDRGDKVTPTKGSVRNFFASLWRFKNGEGSTTDVKENSKGLYAVFSSTEEE
jgi:hypothetical protein